MRKKKKKEKSLEKVYLAIDPGKNGGICILYEDYAEAYKCPPSPKKMAELMRKINNHCYVDGYEIICLLEKVHAFPTDARSSAFKFGANYGMWQGILSSLNIDYELVTPQKWQKEFDLPKTKKERKQDLKRIAKCFYEKATLYTSDAICMAIWKRANER